MRQLILFLLLSVLFQPAWSQVATLTIDAGPDRTVLVEQGVTSFVLAATVRENGVLVPKIRVQWHKISGPGNFTADEDRAITTGHVSAPGTYVLRAVALDYTPNATVLSPADNSSYSRQVPIKGGAIDDIRIARMEVYVDNKLLASNTNLDMISATWDLRSKKISIGPHEIKVMAYDNAGLRGWETITMYKTR